VRAAAPRAMLFERLVSRGGAGSLPTFGLGGIVLLSGDRGSRCERNECRPS
jgi:hypothetical protein